MLDELYKSYVDNIFSVIFSDQLTSEIRFRNTLEREVYKKALIHSLYDVKGDIRDKLREHYVRMNFFEEDLKSLDSGQWGAVLNSLVSIDILDSEEVPLSVVKCLDFENIHIKLCAFKILSKYEFPELEEIVKSHWESLALERQDFVYSILKNLVKRKSILEYLILKPTLTTIICKVLENEKFIDELGELLRSDILNKLSKEQLGDIQSCSNNIGIVYE